MKSATLLLVFSLTANALLSFALVRHATAATAAFMNRPGSGMPSRAEDFGASAVVDLKSLSPAALQAALTKLRLPQETVDALVRARIYARYEARRRELIFGTVQSSPWWRSAGLRIDPMRVLTPAQRKELRDLEATARNDTLALLGPSALDRDGSLAYRYRFVSQEKAVRLDALERDYKDFGADLDESSRWLRTPGDVEQRKLLATEHERDLAALLTPEEREIFEMLESPVASHARLPSRMADFAASEAEYRAVFDLQKGFEDRFPQMRGGPMTAEAGAAFFGALNQLQDDIHASLGDVRYADWLLTGQPYYNTLLQVATANDLSQETVKKVAGIVADTINGSWRIAQDATLTGPEKKSALTDLVAGARVQVASQMGAELAGAFLKNSSTYFDAMASGTAIMMRAAGGTGFTAVDSNRLPSAPEPPKP